MKEEYDFSQSVKNPYTSKLKDQVVIALDDEVIKYFQSQAEEMGISHQRLIQLYLQDCVRSKRSLK